MVDLPRRAPYRTGTVPYPRIQASYCSHSTRAPVICKVPGHREELPKFLLHLPLVTRYPHNTPAMIIKTEFLGKHLYLEHSVSTVLHQGISTHPPQQNRTLVLYETNRMYEYLSTRNLFPPLSSTLSSHHLHHPHHHHGCLQAREKEQEVYASWRLRIAILVYTVYHMPKQIQPSTRTVCHIRPSSLTVSTLHFQTITFPSHQTIHKSKNKKPVPKETQPLTHGVP